VVSRIAPIVEDRGLLPVRVMIVCMEGVCQQLAETGTHPPTQEVVRGAVECCGAHYALLQSCLE
jgi:hypothetical protein